MNNQISSQSPKLPFFYRNLPIILGAIIVIITGGVFAWQYFGVPETEEIVPAEEKIMAPADVKDEIADWKSYQGSAMGGFSVKYPLEFTAIETPYREFSPACPEIYFYRFSSREKIKLKHGSENAMEVRINICSEVGWPGSFQEWINIQKTGRYPISEETISFTEKNITLGGRPATKLFKVFSHKYHLGSPYKQILIYIYTYNEEGALEMTAEIDFEKQNIYLPIFNQMLSTFRFLESEEEKAEEKVKVPEEYEFIELGKEYEKVLLPTNIGGKLAYAAVRKFPEWFIVYSGKEIGKGGFLPALPPVSSSFVDIGGKLAYAASIDRDSVIVFDGKVFGREYDTVSTPVNIGGKLAYKATENNKSFFVFKERPGRKYDIVINPVDVAGRLAYSAFKNNKWFIVYNGKEIGKEFDIATNAVSVGGKLAFEAVKNGKRFIVYNGKEIGKEYQLARHPVDIGGKLAYFAMKMGEVRGRQVQLRFIIYDGKEVGKEYPPTGLGDFTEVNGKLAYIGLKEGKECVIYKGKRTGKCYDNIIGSPIEINGKIAFLVNERHGEEQFIVYNGKEIGKQYDGVADIVNIEGKLAFRAERDGKSFIVLQK